MAELLPASPEAITIAGQRLRGGRLVAFPTETVYGLGANALDAVAAQRIFEVKGRPPTDPLIVHVPKLENVAALWDADQDTVGLAMRIGRALWPGPLTLVARASAAVPPAVTGGSGFVGVRVPDHAVALALLEAAGVPVAAPSANTFGHVSPTSAAHVAADLALRDTTLTILDGGSCGVGIESTVVKLTSPQRLEVLRRGKVTVAALQAAVGSGVAITIRDTRTKYTREDEAMDGPGQLLTHYSPCVPAFLLAPHSVPSGADLSASDWVLGAPSGAAAGKVVVIDFGRCLGRLEPHCLAYRNLSDRGDASEACRSVFDALRWCETVEGAEAVVLPLISEWIAAEAVGGKRPDDELIDAVEDRLFRAASGCVVTVNGAAA